MQVKVWYFDCAIWCGMVVLFELEHHLPDNGKLNNFQVATSRQDTRHDIQRDISKYTSIAIHEKAEHVL